MVSLRERDDRTFSGSEYLARKLPDLAVDSRHQESMARVKASGRLRPLARLAINAPGKTIACAGGVYFLSLDRTNPWNFRTTAKLCYVTAFL
ncbi:hypothetical protein V3F56_08145 [Moorellaceae bacterium AZ2]